MGVEFQYWGSQVAGALSPQFEMGGWVDDLLVGLSFAPYFGLDRVDGYAVQDLRWGLPVTVRPFEWLRLGAAPLLSWVQASGPLGAVGGTTHSLRPGIEFFGEGVIQLDHWVLSLRAGLSALTAARSIEEDDVPVITIPSVQPLVGLGVSFVFDPPAREQ